MKNGLDDYITYLMKEQRKDKRPLSELNEKNMCRDIAIMYGVNPNSTAVKKALEDLDKDC